MLKSIWPDCYRLVEELPCSFLPPALIVAQFSALILANAPDRRQKDKPPAFPDLPTFRRLVHGKDDECKEFLNALKDILNKGHAKRLIEAAQSIMLYCGSRERPFRLLPAQAAQLARSRSRVFLLFLSWLDSRLDEQGSWVGLDEEAHRRVLGLITALSWFGWYRKIALPASGPSATVCMNQEC